ncbi:MAG TPA: hypothetical protein VK968_15920 [Roseimicrobium sp.]|nr:hypothetical protein [Roseimicrobium sp.]
MRSGLNAKKTLTLLSVAIAALAYTGCVTTPPAQPAVSAYQLGDRSTLGLDEIVVSLPLKEASEPYHNLHLQLGVIINPVATETAAPTSSYKQDYSNEAEALVRRLAPRINATVSRSLSELAPQSIRDAAAVRQKAIAQAESVLTPVLRNWTHAADYKIEIVVLTHYWTDPSLGRIPPTTTSRW